MALFNDSEHERRLKVLEDAGQKLFTALLLQDKKMEAMNKMVLQLFAICEELQKAGAADRERYLELQKTIMEMGQAMEGLLSDFLKGKDQGS